MIASVQTLGVVMPARYLPERTRLDVHQFQRMGEAGILDPDARVELVDGELLNMAPIGPRHAFAVATLARLLGRAAGEDELFVTSQSPVILSRFSEPQPDVLVLRGPVRRYCQQTPRAEDVIVLVEVSDTTLAFDRGRKLRVYARAGVEEVWLLDLQANALEMHRHPRSGRYRERHVLQRGEIAVSASMLVSVDWSGALGV